MPDIRLTCLTEDDAAAVAAEAHRPDDQMHTARQDGADVVIGYSDKRFPLDIADWAYENDHASDHEAARLIGAL